MSAFDRIVFGLRCESARLQPRLPLRSRAAAGRHGLFPLNEKREPGPFSHRAAFVFTPRLRGILHDGQFESFGERDDPIGVDRQPRMSTGTIPREPCGPSRDRRASFHQSHSCVRNLDGVGPSANIRSASMKTVGSGIADGVAGAMNVSAETALRRRVRRPRRQCG